MKIFNGQIITAAIMVAIFASMVGVSTTYPANARMVPLIIGIPGTILCLIQLVSEILASYRLNLDAERPSPISSSELVREIKFFLWFPAFIASVLVCGFFVTTLVLVFLFLRLDQRESMKLSTSLSVGGALVLYVIFNLVLGLPLYPGFVYDWLVS